MRAVIKIVLVFGTLLVHDFVNSNFLVYFYQLNFSCLKSSKLVYYRICRNSFDSKRSTRWRVYNRHDARPTKDIKMKRNPCNSHLEKEEAA